MRLKGFILTSDALLALSLALAASMLLVGLTSSPQVSKGYFYSSQIGGDVLSLSTPSLVLSTLGVQGSFSDKPQGGRLEVRVVDFSYPSCFSSNCLKGQDLVLISGEFNASARKQLWVKLG